MLRGRLAALTTAAVVSATLMVPTASASASSGAGATAGVTTSTAPSVAAAAAACGTPAGPRLMKWPIADRTVPQGAYFAFPNRSTSERVAIRNRVIDMINSTWGAYDVAACNAQNKPYWQRRHGLIKIATWSFNDWGVRDALVRAAQRGTVIAVVAAKGVNAENDYKPWSSLRSYLNTNANSPYRNSTEAFVPNRAYECAGACRGYGGTPHSKFFMFDGVGGINRDAPITSRTVMQSSMNLTEFAYKGQWNQALMLHNSGTWSAFNGIFDQMARQLKYGYRAYPASGYPASGVANIFFPGGKPSNDPVLNTLNQVRCTGTKLNGGRTAIRVIQYALYDDRGNAIAKKLRSLWNSGCDIRIIYSVTSRPVLSILRATSGRGPVPMKQSVIKNRAGEIVKYNHSKWLSVYGNWRGVANNATVLSGSANWSDFAYSCDEQMQQIMGGSWAAAFMANHNKTWAQSTSRKPTAGGTPSGARTLPEQPVFGQGIYRYLTEGG